MTSAPTSIPAAPGPARRVRIRPFVAALLTAPTLTLGLLGPAITAGAAPVPGSTSTTQTQAQTQAQVRATAVATPKTPVLPAGIEALADYVPANSCSPTARRGTTALGHLLVTTYPNTTYGGSRSCGALPDSEHHDGRAVDWMNSIRDTTKAAQAKAVITWMLATDSAGNRYANARRLGVMYIIWNGKIWGAYSADRGWRPYSSCADHKEKAWDTTCHRDHMHISLSWAGAMGRTSFWSGSVAKPDFGRCRPADLNWAYVYRRANPNPCPRVSRVSAPQGASELRQTLTRYSGRPFALGSTGAGVKAVQQAIGLTPTGTFGPVTVAAMKRWQDDHDVPLGTGGVSYATWRALLKATR